MSEPLMRNVVTMFALEWDDGVNHFYAVTDDGVSWHFDEDKYEWETFLPPIPHTYAWQRQQGTFHG